MGKNSRNLWRYLPTQAWLIGSTVSDKDLRTNSVDALRLGLAVLVILSHAYPLSGRLNEPLAVWSQGQTSLGEVAVAGFFALSGYLITRSYEKSASLPRYLWHRALRVFPGLWVCLLITAFILAPVFAQQSGMSLQTLWSAPDGPIAYIIANWGINIRQWGIAGLPVGIPYPHALDGSLWSLWVEFRCYLVLAALGALGVVHHARWLVPVITALLLAALVTTLIDPTILTGSLTGKIYWSLMDSTPLNLELYTCFFVGATAYIYRRHLLLSPLVALGAFVGFVLMAPTALGPISAALLLSYGMLTVGFRVGVGTASKLRRIGDISYGTYIYAFPVQQLLAQFGLAALPVWIYMFCGVIVTLPIAYMSYRLVEAPSLRLKSLGMRKAPKAARAVAETLQSAISGDQREPDLVQVGPLTQQDSQNNGL